MKSMHACSMSDAYVQLIVTKLNHNQYYHIVDNEYFLYLYIRRIVSDSSLCVIVCMCACAYQCVSFCVYISVYLGQY